MAGENAIQPAAVTNGVWILYPLCPAVGMILAVGMLLFYKLRTSDVQVMAQYNNKKITRGDAEKYLRKKYGAAADLKF